MHEQVRCERHPLRERLAWNMNVVPCGEDFFLPVEWEVVAKLADDYRCDKPRCSNASLLHRFEPRDDRRCKRMIFANVFFAHDVTFEKFRWLVVEQLGALFADEPPGVWVGFYRLGNDPLFDDAEIIRRARLALFPRARR
jgi:hypothetical protein